MGLVDSLQTTDDRAGEKQGAFDLSAVEYRNIKPLMKPPLSYYGGKQKLSKAICAALYMSPNWSERGHYIEPYFGGGAVFLPKSRRE